MPDVLDFLATGQLSQLSSLKESQQLAHAAMSLSTWSSSLTFLAWFYAGYTLLTAGRFLRPLPALFVGDHAVNAVEPAAGVAIGRVHFQRALEEGGGASEFAPFFVN
jgi:hypothetical protein